MTGSIDEAESGDAPLSGKSELSSNLPPERKTDQKTGRWRILKMVGGTRLELMTSAV